MLGPAVESTRHALIDRFLSQHLKGDYERHVLAADASFRRYERILHAGGRLVLMDAPPPHEDTRPFAAITRLLRSAGLHAPSLIAEAHIEGLLLLEDLGDNLFSRHLHTAPDDEWRLYRAAIDVLLHTRAIVLPEAVASPYNNAEYRRELSIFAEWFLPEMTLENEQASFMAIWDELLEAAPLRQNTLVLRDFHADNLIWLEELDGLAKVGLLDYQDALIGDAAYDLVSLLEDARRDVSPETTRRSLDDYLERSGENEADFFHRYALLGAQRNCKIIGIFHRLHRRDGKARYLDFLPRVWGHLAHDLKHPSLAPLQMWMQQHCRSHLPC